MGGEVNCDGVVAAEVTLPMFDGRPARRRQAGGRLYELIPASRFADR
jgi:hypothetical protein